MRCNFVGECFVYGDSMKSHNVVMVHPALDQLTKLVKPLNIEETDPVKLCEMEEVKKALLEEMNKQGKKDNLFGFEMARQIKLFPKPLSSFGIYTATMKLQRLVARKVF